MGSRARLMNLIITQIKEPDLKHNAEKFGIQYSQLVASSFSSKVRELILYLERHGQTLKFLTHCQSLFSDSTWQEIGKESETEFAARFIDAQGNPLECLRLVIFYCFNWFELNELATAFDIKMNQELPVSQKCDCIEQLTTPELFSQVAKNVKEKRPFVSQAQNLPSIFSKPNGKGYSRFEEECGRLQKLTNMHRPQLQAVEPLYNFQHLIPALLEITEIELKEVCFDCDLSFDALRDDGKEGKIGNLVIVLERTTDFLRKSFFFSIHRHFPNTNWLELAGLDPNILNNEIYKYREGFDTFAVRQLCLAVWTSLDDVLEFCEAHFPYSRSHLGIEMSYRENIHRLIGSHIRRGHFPDFLETLETHYPTQFAQFSPYTSANSGNE